VLVRVGYTVGDLEVLVVGMTVHLEANHMLVALHKGTETSACLNLEVVRLNVSNNINETSCSFSLSKLSLKPSDLVARVVSLAENPPVLVICRLRVEADDFAVLEDFAAGKFEGHRVVAVFAELVNGFLANPLGPAVLEVVNRIVDAGGAEVFNIDGPGVVVTLDGVDNNIVIAEGVLNGTSNLQGVLSDFLVGVGPHVVGRVVSCPEEQVWLLHFFDMLKHVQKSVARQVTLVATPFAGSEGRVRRVAPLFTAARVATALPEGTFLVFQVDVRIRHVNGLESGTRVGVVSDLSVQVVGVVVVQNLSGFISQDARLEILES